MSNPPPDKHLSKEDRQRLDPIFMDVVRHVQVQAQETAPQGSSGVAAMFHREQQKDALQGVSELIADWNEGQIRRETVAKTAAALRSLGLEEQAERVEKLHRIDED